MSFNETNKLKSRFSFFHQVKWQFLCFFVLITLTASFCATDNSVSCNTTNSPTFGLEIPPAESHNTSNELLSSSRKKNNNFTIYPSTVGSFTIYSNIVGDNFTIYVTLPSGYSQEAPLRYPVIYMLDGDWY
ncbi:MAG: hypothetical protein ACFFBD_11395, partial [Candidatus Hodarchaeota archaeon]